MFHTWQMEIPSKEQQMLFLIKNLLQDKRRATFDEIIIQSLSAHFFSSKFLACLMLASSCRLPIVVNALFTSSTFICNTRLRLAYFKTLMLESNKIRNMRPFQNDCTHSKQHFKHLFVRQGRYLFRKLDFCNICAWAKILQYL